MSRRDDPFDDLQRVFERMTRQFEDAAKTWDEDFFGFDIQGSQRISIDLADRDSEFVVTADVPGFHQDDIEVRLADNTLHIEAEHEESEEAEEGTYLRRERRRRSMSRSVRLPEPVEDDEVSATYQNGVLTITLPKVEPTRDEGRSIDID